MSTLGEDPTEGKDEGASRAEMRARGEALVGYIEALELRIAELRVSSADAEARARAAEARARHAEAREVAAVQREAESVSREQEVRQSLDQLEGRLQSVRELSARLGTELWTVLLTRARRGDAAP